MVKDVLVFVGLLLAAFLLTLGVGATWRKVFRSAPGASDLRVLHILYHPLSSCTAFYTFRAVCSGHNLATGLFGFMEKSL